MKLVTKSGIEVVGTPQEIQDYIALEEKRDGIVRSHVEANAEAPARKRGRSTTATTSAKKSAKKAKKNGKKKNGKRRAPSKRWTPALFKAFCAAQVPRVRETIAAGFKAGAGANSQAIAKLTGWPMQGVGKRVMKVVTQTEKFSKSLPPPIQFIGDGGDRTLVVDPTCLAAAGGGLT